MKRLLKLILGVFRRSRCTCGLENSRIGIRYAVVCPKHDGEVIVSVSRVIKYNHKAVKAIKLT